MTRRQLVSLYREQPRLERPVCMASHKGDVCVLLAAHSGKHVSSKGKTW